MPTPLNPDDALRRARELQESRIAIIDDLARSNVELSHARERLTTAESEYGRFHSAALGAGWTGAELSKIGFIFRVDRIPLTTCGRPELPPGSTRPQVDSGTLAVRTLRGLVGKTPPPPGYPRLCHSTAPRQGRFASLRDAASLTLDGVPCCDGRHVSGRREGVVMRSNL